MDPDVNSSFFDCWKFRFYVWILLLRVEFNDVPVCVYYACEKFIARSGPTPELDNNTSRAVDNLKLSWHSQKAQPIQRCPHR